MKDKRIGFIGQGWVGKHYADDFENRGYKVIRYSQEEPHINNDNKIRECDIVFAYLEASNPVIINIALELGFAKGLGKVTILVNEWTEENISKGMLETLKPNGNWFKPRYLEMLIDWCDFVVTDFKDGIELLKKFV